MMRFVLSLREEGETMRLVEVGERRRTGGRRKVERGEELK